jgi:short-chain fatty acids transporter
MTDHHQRNTNILQRWGAVLTTWTERWIPDALVIVWILTAVCFIFALIWGDVSPVSAVKAWGNGFWVLLEFGMQVCLTMMTGYIVASAPLIRRTLQKLASLPNPDKPAQSIILMSLFSMVTAWLSWAFSLIASALFAVFLVHRNQKVDYRLLVAAAYLGLGCTWHAGLSASAPLLVNTPDNFLIQGEILQTTIPATETIFSFFNIILLVLVILVVTAMMAVMHPSAENSYRIKPELLEQLQLFQAPEKPQSMSPSMRLNWWPGFNLIVGVVGLAWLVGNIARLGFANAITLNTINFFFLMLGILLHWYPWRFLKAAENAGRVVWGVIIQFPFYAGIFGLFKFTNLATAFTKAFIAIGSKNTFLLIAYWYAGILNYFIPSGGSEWAVTAPYLIPAGNVLGVDASKIVVAYAWGDMMTDMIQPFWAIAMLAIVKLEFREIMGRLLLVFFVYLGVTSLAFFVWPLL